MSEPAVRQADESPRECEHEHDHEHAQDAQDERDEVLGSSSSKTSSSKRPREVQEHEVHEEHSEGRDAKRLQTDAVEVKYDASQVPRQMIMNRNTFAAKKPQSDVDLIRASLSEVMQELARLRGHVDQSLEKMRAEMRLEEVKNEARSVDCRALERGFRALASHVGDLHGLLNKPKDEGNEDSQSLFMGDSWNTF
jgi:hypothetical protein